MDKRTIMAVVIAAVILFGYQFYISNRYPDAYNTVPAEPKTTDVIGRMPAERSGASPIRADYAAEAISQNYDVTPGKTTTIETDKYVVTLSNVGGCIKSISLKEYPPPGKDEAFKLVDIELPEEGIFNLDGFDTPHISRLRYQATEERNKVVFRGETSTGLQIVKKYIFHNLSYHIELEIYIFNPTMQPVYAEYSIVAGSNIDIPTRLDRRYAQLVSHVSGKARRDNGKKGEGVTVEGTVNYAGLQNKYFSVITKPSAPTKGLVLSETKDNNILSSIKLSKFRVDPNTGTSHSYLLFAGPTKKEFLKPYELQEALSYGFFGGISQILVSGLALFHRVFRNWGVSIILLSALVNLALFPLSRKSYESMKKMQEIQPHMEKLRSEHKDNPNKLNKEMMALYKTYNVNPMGGCLPLFLQIPVFIALYQGLMRSIELRGAHFLWIKDLSMPDGVPLPFSLPAIGSSVNILPILMAVAMVFQQKMSTKKGGEESPQAKQQRQMMVLMPVMFLFIMYSFPSGLVLYWLTNTVLTMFEQRVIMHR
ncbi:MAG: membrane protein insertase YidC [Candidatus Omnitrophica bacterium]|nr:membrane protein insertase YidC [Candidatus Omnitrophota bacterium]